MGYPMVSLSAPFCYLENVCIINSPSLMRRCVGLVSCCSVRSSRSSSYFEDIFQGGMSTQVRLSGLFAFCLGSGFAYVFGQIVS